MLEAFGFGRLYCFDSLCVIELIVVVLEEFWSVLLVDAFVLVRFIVILL